MNNPVGRPRKNRDSGAGNSGREHHALHATNSGPGEDYDNLLDEDYLDEQNTNTTQCPARDGYRQRWVRYQTREGADTANVGRRLQQGWTARGADTLPEGSMLSTTDMAGLGSVIGNHELVLMEIPVAKADRINARAQKRADNQRKAADNNLFNVHRQGDGFGRPQVLADNSFVERGGGRSVRVNTD